ncbi:MAG: DUF1501 domain-containing protein [Verrucomicrobiales bacterium]|jgi:hypothetical protein|nr:DUF1501 domain-containing protein [Verrucomicrobiales bacterium]
MKDILDQSNELTRRRFAQHAASSLLGVGLLPATSSSLFGAGADAATEKQIATAKRVIYLYMNGGMSHLDTLDVKPGAETQGPTKAISTSADGLQISEYLPRLANHGHHLGIVNSLMSRTGAHQQGNYLMHTSYEMRGTIKHPGMGAWLLKFKGRDNPTLPANVVIGGGSRHPGAGFFESAFGPVSIGDPKKGLQNVKSYLSEEDFQYRVGLSEKLGQNFRETYGAKKNIRAYSSAYDDAVKLMDSPDLEAFDLSKESEETREAYGSDRFGQGCLLARRLVETGVKFVEVSLGGWDTHQGNFVRVPERCDILDRGMSSLISDLELRGLLDDTLIVLTSEFGRTPRINQNVGRDHYPKAFSCAFAGGGIVGGRRWGKTDETGETVVENQVGPADINATIGYALGLPLDQVLYSPSKRPFTAAHKGKPIVDLFA